MKKADLKVLLFFLVLVVVLRAPTFFFSVASDWDESIYILIARGMVEGKMLYAGLWDQKPPGIFVLFALGQKIFGDPIVSARLLFAMAVWATSFIVYRLVKILFKKEGWPAAAAGALYILFSAHVSNTETIFAPFVALGFYFLFSHTLNIRRKPLDKTKLFLSGLCFGAALQINAVNIFVFLAAIGLLGRAIYSSKEASGRTPAARWWEASLWLGVAPLMMWYLIVFYFWCQGHLPDYLQANILSPLFYAAMGEAGLSLSRIVYLTAPQISGYWILWLGLGLLPFYFAIEGTEPENKRSFGWILIWSLAAAIGLLATGRLEYHSFQELFLPLCLVTGGLFLYIQDQIRFLDIKKQRLVLLVLILSSGVLAPLGGSCLEAMDLIYYRCYKGQPYWNDDPAAIAAYIRPQLQKGDCIFVVDYEPIVYYLSGARIPSKYFSPEFLRNQRFSTLAGIDPLRELDAIMAQKPKFVLVRAKMKERDSFTIPNESYYRRLNEYLKKCYVPDYHFKAVRLFRYSSCSIRR